jgi:hypothetical protein
MILADVDLARRIDGFEAVCEGKIKEIPAGNHSKGDTEA